MMCVVAMATDMGNPAFWAWCQDVSHKHVGSVVGWGNMWGNIGAALAPVIIVRVKGLYPDDPAMGWNAVFLMCAVVQVFGTLASLGIDSTHPINAERVKAG
jgi:nitrate/nitrite transporter NarK